MLDDSPDPGFVSLKLSPCGRILVASGETKMQIYDSAAGVLAFETDEGSNVSAIILTS
jgi:hypothetical protein